MLNTVSRTSLLGRNVMKNFIRNGSHGPPIPGHNLPFDIHSRPKVTFHVMWYTLTGIASPFLILLHQLRKK